MSNSSSIKTREYFSLTLAAMNIGLLLIYFTARKNIERSLKVFRFLRF